MKQAIVIVWLVTSAAFCVAQVNQAKQSQSSTPRFSGTWELDRSQSKVTKENPVNSGGTITLFITHNEPEIRIIQKTNWNGKEKTTEFAYYTDGRGKINPTSYQYLSFYNGNENPSAPSPRTIGSKTSWKSNKVKTRYAIVVRNPDGRRTKIDVEEEWELSHDGKTLIQTTSFSNNDEYFDTFVEPRKLKKVFNKT